MDAKLSGYTKSFCSIYPVRCLHLTGRSYSDSATGHKDYVATVAEPSTRLKKPSSPLASLKPTAKRAGKPAPSPVLISKLGRG